MYNIIRHLFLPGGFSDWRYWSTAVLYFPLTVYLFIVGLFKGKIFYFAAANPKIPLGGFASESKYDILSMVPTKHVPTTILIKQTDTIPQMMEKVTKNKISFPLFAKPNQGEGGFLCKKINHAYELYRYHKNHPIDFIIQAYVDEPYECSVLFHTAKQTPQISSITERSYFSITGDGKSTISQLIQNSPIGFANYNTIIAHIPDQENMVLKEGESFYPAPLGNRYCGATFINLSHHVTPFLVDYFNQLNQQINLFNYARYDIKCASLEALLNGEFTIVEINGVKGEPIHIYDRQYSIVYAYREIFKHWNYILDISKHNLKQGAKVPNFKDGCAMLYNHYQFKKNAIKKRKLYE